MIRCRIPLRRCAYCLAAAALWLLLSAGAANAHPNDVGTHDKGESAVPADQASESDSKTRGIGLGEFRIRAHYPVEAKRSTVTFTLYGIVASENAGEFERLLENRTQKVRDQVIVATRLAPLADFDDPELKQFRRRILLRLRRALPELEMDDIYVSDFQLEVREI